MRDTYITQIQATPLYIRHDCARSSPILPTTPARPITAIIVTVTRQHAIAHPLAHSLKPLACPLIRRRCRRSSPTAESTSSSPRRPVQDKRCSAYLAAAKAKLQGARTLEICMDDARFSSKEH